MACSGVEVEGATASATARRRFIVAGRAFHHTGILPSKQTRLGRSPQPVSHVRPVDRRPRTKQRSASHAARLSRGVR